MRVKQAHSLLWLSRWYNGRYERLNELYDQHLQDLEALVRKQLGKRKSCHHRKLVICGIKFVVSLTEYQGLELHEVGDAAKYTGIQRELFTPVRRVRRKPDLQLQEAEHEAAA